jgi:quercetin dioxygenase-like cupin family protein
VEVAYVLEGSLEYQLGRKPSVTLEAGDSLFIPGGTIHSARNVGTGNASELATSVIEKGNPPVVSAPSEDRGVRAGRLGQFIEGARADAMQ